MRTRAWRRYQRDRMNQRAFFILYNCKYFDKKQALELAPYWRDHLAKCSCWMCGNPRRHGWYGVERRTLSERRAMDAFSDGLEEIES